MMHMHIVPSALSLICGVSEDTELQFSNPHDGQIIYKVRSTTPARYLVRPREGIIAPRATETISIQLHRPETLSAVDQFQIEYRVLSPNESIPKRSDITTRLRQQVALNTNEIKEVDSMKKIITCTLSSQQSPTPVKQRAASAYSVDTPNSRQPATTPTSPQSALTTAESRLNDLDRSIELYRTQVAEQKVAYESLTAKKRTLEAKNIEESGKIAHLTQKQRLERETEGIRAPLWVGALMMVVCAIVARYIV